MFGLNTITKDIFMENNLNLYYIFYVAARTQNISAAARELYISQPAISKAISKLEQNLETTLFIRNSRGVCLTPEGEMLYEQVHTAFHCIQTGEEKIRLANELGIGHLSIGASTTLCKYVLLPYLKEFTRQNPHIQISISCQSSMETLEALNKNTIDIGLIGYPDSKSNLELLPVMEIHDTFVTTDRYLNNFKKRDPLIKDSIIKNATFIMLNKDNMTRKYVDANLSASQIELHNIIEASNMDLLIEFCKTDLGIACVLREFVMEELKNGILKEIRILKNPPGRHIGFAYHSQTPKDNPSLALFLEMLQK